MPPTPPEPGPLNVVHRVRRMHGLEEHAREEKDECPQSCAAPGGGGGCTRTLSASGVPSFVQHTTGGRTPLPGPQVAGHSTPRCVATCFQVSNPTYSVYVVEYTQG